MSKGKRYEEPKLNLKKVFAVILAFIVFIMFIFIIKGILTKDKEQVKITSKDYVVIFQNNKWGVMDSNGNQVIDPSYQEMITIPNKKEDVFLCIYDVNYQTGEYKTKALNSKNEEILTQYEQVEAISNQDANQNVWYEDKAIKVKKDGKYGIINLEGKELTPCQYDNISAIEEMKNALKVAKDGKEGILNNEGKEILPMQYTEITSLGKDNKEGFIVKGENGKYGIVNYSNEPVIEAKYDEILSGEKGKIERKTDASGRIIGDGEEQYVKAIDGDSIELSIDTNIQSIATKYLEEACIDNECEEGGVVIIMEPKTGDILAMVAYPEYNLNDPFTINTEEITSAWNRIF